MNISVVEKSFLSSWWVVIILLLCLAFYEYEQKKRNKVSTILEAKINELQIEKNDAIQKNKRLLMNINSQNDPAWIELILIQKMGLTPEGQTKIFFKESSF